ncbi:Noc2-domain-containing protein [Fomitiporia mediterranea MF3/22]|uniref:Noc2-domain-containing protein n=1 Tax=Fomitiporia mediterranea (strain MF3/22) TaxID=694068 RepID=UPI0004407B70|nr:Noc2-domain-containing protein [Fomitiporia mediterranea MF3/22]EJD05007.1 Noc2-domain-containing protein [Fomitiporia mediterranea MF3/22]
MSKKANKASRKYAASGQLKKQIQSRKKHQQMKRNIEWRKGSKGRGKVANLNEIDGEAEQRGMEVEDVEGVSEDVDEEISGEETEKFKGMSVDDFLRGGFMEGASDDGTEENGSSENDEDNVSFASVDELEDEAGAHKIELKKLAQQDPEFYKYLQENDRELLDFDVPDGVDEDEDMGEDAMEADDDEEIKAPTLTKEILQRWQKAILEHRSLRALRRLLIAFRAAAHMNEEDEVLAWTIDSPSVYEKLVTTALRYTPIVLDHHVPYKKLPNGKFKPPPQTPKLQTIQKLILSFFHNVLHLIEQLSASETLVLALNESAKLLPYVISSRKAVKLYLKTCLKLWSSAEDEVRIAAFLAIRRLVSSSDEAIRDQALKNTYLTLLRNAKSTTAYNLPSINLMKNSASELYCEDHAASYQLAFGYIRQLAVHLRNSMKVKSKDAYKQVYNWQFAHSVDFWAIVLARACEVEAEAVRGEESGLKALIYPLIQVALGAIKLITNSRSYPFHLSIIRSLIHLSRHTTTYIPLTPYLLPIITSTLSPSGKPKASTLRPLDLETHLRTPAQYVRTRIYNNVVLEEAVFLLAEWCALPHVQGSIAFPELVVPLVATLRHSLKKASGAKEAGVVKGLLERIEEGATWVSERRKNVAFGPRDIDAVHAWERDVRIQETPLGRFVKSQRKVREKRKKLVDKARAGEEEYLEE